MRAREPMPLEIKKHLLHPGLPTILCAMLSLVTIITFMLFETSEVKKDSELQQTATYVCSVIMENEAVATFLGIDEKENSEETTETQEKKEKGTTSETDDTQGAEEKIRKAAAEYIEKRNAKTS